MTPAERIAWLQSRMEARTARTLAPLRRVLRRERNEHGVTIEVLACGHRLIDQGDDARTGVQVRQRRCGRCVGHPGFYDAGAKP